ncbi:MAG: hypothetical protein HY700_00830 [Gemmatimonadetes bacterium]|nr:hypothetical protein [Gemmatimonadota bacterium]
MRSIALALLVGSGMWPAGSVAPRAAEPDKATVSVTNRNLLDVDVFALVGGERYRLGAVVTSQSAVFDLPARAIGSSDVRMAADPVGSRETYTSEAVTVRDGEQITMVVANRLPQSTVTVARMASH